MKTEKNILIAFLLNISFSIFELIAGAITNSVAIVSDAIHDFGDALSIGVSYFLEKKSKKKSDDKYTYGYTRFSILGAAITNAVLITGSTIVIINGIKRIIHPVSLNYDSMILFAIFGVVVNFLAAYFTRGKDSLNQKAVNLHMLEDVLGWVVVLIGSIIIKFTEKTIIDSIMSIGVALFILYNALKSFKEIGELFLEKVPSGIKVEELKEHIQKIDGVENVHHIHIWSMDGVNNMATMHIVTNIEDTHKLKDAIKEELREHGISHTTIEIENAHQICNDTNCNVEISEHQSHHHHHEH